MTILFIYAKKKKKTKQNKTKGPEHEREFP